MVFRDEDGFELLGLTATSRDMDRQTIEEVGLPGRVLMELAGAGTARLIRERLGGRPGRATVLCGPGGNGGDGYVIARHLMSAGWQTRCVSMVGAGGLRGDAAANHAAYVALGGSVHEIGARLTPRMSGWLGHADVIVDALLGTGQDRPVDGAVAELVNTANEKDHGQRVSVDVPTGVDADTGAALGPAFQADFTATYGLSKIGLHQHPGAGLAGEVRVVDIALPLSVVEGVGAPWRLASEQAVTGWLPTRPVDGHKGAFGHVGIVGGAPGMEGAAVLAATAALRAGAGLVTWNRPGPMREVPYPPEVMTHLSDDSLDERPTVWVVGPGLGTAQRDRLLDAALATDAPAVLDADALNMLAARGESTPLPGAVLTPHPGEAGRLLGRPAAEVQANRPGAAAELADRFGATVILKGAATVIASPGLPGVIVPIADAALSTGGSGDVLAGVVGGLRAQGCCAHRAAVVGAWLHAAAGSRLGAQRGHQGVLAGEIADAIPAVVGDLRAGWAV